VSALVRPRMCQSVGGKPRDADLRPNKARSKQLGQATRRSAATQCRRERCRRTRCPDARSRWARATASMKPAPFSPRSAPSWSARDDRRRVSLRSAGPNTAAKCAKREPCDESARAARHSARQTRKAAARPESGSGVSSHGRHGPHHGAESCGYHPFAQRQPTDAADTRAPREVPANRLLSSCRQNARASRARQTEAHSAEHQRAVPDPVAPGPAACRKCLVRRYVFFTKL